MTALSLVVSCAGCLALARAQQRENSISDADARRLELGYLVARPRSERRGDLQLIGGTSFEIIDLAPDDVWEAVDHPVDYWKILPATRETREVGRTDDGARVVYILQVRGPVRVSYYVRMSFEPATHTMEFRLVDDRAHSILAGWGFLRLSPWGSERTLVSWGVLADPGHGALVDFLRDEIAEALLRVPLHLRRHLGFTDPEVTFPSEREMLRHRR